MYSASKPTAFRSRRASGRTWLPIPSPGIVTTVYFAITSFPFYVNPSLFATRFSAPPAITSDCGPLPSGGKTNFSPRHAIVPEVKSISTSSPGILISPPARSREINIHVFARDDRFFLGRDLRGALLPQSLDELGNLHAQKSVVVGVPQVGLRKTGRNHQRNAFRFQAGDRLFTARSGAEVEAADDHVSGVSARGKLRVVVLHDHSGHQLRRHIVAVGVILAVDGVGV